MDEELMEKKIGSETIFDGNLLHVRRDTVCLPNWKSATREWIQHPGASSVIPVFPDKQILLVRQYRYPIGQVTLEVPAGKLDSPEEDPLTCAKRELSEETGYEADRLKKLSVLATTVGFSNELIHMYVAEGLKPGVQHPDEDEFIHLVRMPLQQAVEMIWDGRIFDAKTVASILMLDSQLKDQ